MKPPIEKNPQAKFALDEHSFQQLLESAYVIQQHGHRNSAKATVSLDPLAEVTETQRLIEVRRLDLRDAAQLIADRSLFIAKASGVAIGMSHDGQLTYLAASGNAVSIAGTSAPISETVSSVSLSENEATAVECPDTTALPKSSADVCRSQNVLSLIVAPSRYEGGISCSLEFRYDSVAAYSADDVRTAGLMANLILEAIARDAGLKWTETVASERNNMLQALDALQPHLERSLAPSVDQTPDPSIPPIPEFTAEFFSQDPAETVFSHERFTEKSATESSAIETDSEVWPVSLIPRSSEPSTALSAAEDIASHPVKDPAEITEVDTPWQSASSAQLWLESARGSASVGSRISTRWQKHRATIYLAVSALLLIIVLSGWGNRSIPNSVRANAPARESSPPQVQLSFFQRTLVSLGLADPPPAPTNLGNPTIQVWIDLHTALYYCPGDPLYGKTAGGRTSLQRDAQLDQFEPAYRKVCE